MGLAFSLGPLFTMMGFSFTTCYCVLAAITFVAGMIAVCLLPSRLNDDDLDEELDDSCPAGSEDS